MVDGVPSPATTYRNVAIFFLLVFLVGCLAPLPTDWRILLGLAGGIGAACCGWAWLAAPRPLAIEAPDLLAELGGGYFERDGLCFLPRLVVDGGLCWFNVYCQNRYDRPVTARAFFVPMEGTSKTGNHDVPPVTVDASCDGGEAAVVCVPYPLARSWQGKIMIYDVYATAEYPGGRGELVRSTEGAPVGEPTSDLKETLTAAALLALGTVGAFAIAVRSTRPRGSFEQRLPDGVPDRVPEGVVPRREVLWQLDLPTGGFPVVPSGAADERH